MPTISFSLAISEVDKAINKLSKYKLVDPDKLMLFAERMAEYGVQLAIKYMGHVDTGETQASIHAVQKDGTTWAVVAGGKAIWIEFGTGVFAPGQTSYPLPLPDGIYRHGEYDKKNGRNINGWYYYEDEPTKKGTTRKKRKHTMGIAGTQFLYHTGQELLTEEVMQRIANEIFNE